MPTRIGGSAPDHATIGRTENRAPEARFRTGPNRRLPAPASRQAPALALVKWCGDTGRRLSCLTRESATISSGPAIDRQVAAALKSHAATGSASPIYGVRIMRSGTASDRQPAETRRHDLPRRDSPHGAVKNRYIKNSGAWGARSDQDTSPGSIRREG